MSSLHDPLRVFHYGGFEIARFVGECDGVEAAAELCREDANRQRRWGRYAAIRPNDSVMSPVEITIRQTNGELQALIIRDPLNPSMTDEAVMSRFEDPDEPVWAVAV